MSRFSQVEEQKEGDDDHICSFYTDNLTVKIECENCIDQVKDCATGKIYDCKCYFKTTVKRSCVKCDILKDCIQSCQEEIEKMLREEGEKIKWLCACDENAFKKIPELVRKMRHCRRVLLQKQNN